MRTHVFALFSVIVLVSLSACASQSAQTASNWKVFQAQVKADEADGRYLDAYAPAQQEIAAAHADLRAGDPDIAVALDDLADIEAVLSLFADGEAHYREALAIQTRSFGHDSKSAAATLAGLGTLEDSRANGGVQAETDVATALALQRRLLASDDPTIAVTLRTLGEVEADNNETDKAVADLAAASATMAKNPAARPADHARALADIGFIKMNNGDFDVAGSLAARALVILDKPGVPQIPELAWALQVQASVYENTNQNTEALPILQRTSAIYTRDYGQSSLSMAAIYENFGAIHDQLQQYPEAEAAYRQAEAVYIQRVGTDSTYLSSLYTTWSGLSLEENKYDQVRGQLEKAMAIDRNNPNQSGYGIDLNNLSVFYANLGDYPKAIDYEKQASAILGKYYPPDSLIMARMLANLGYNYSMLDDSSLDMLKQSIDYSNQALAIHLKKDDIDEAAADASDISRCYYNLHDIENAIRYSSMGLELLEKKFGSQYPGVLNALNDLDSDYLYEHDYKDAESTISKASVLAKRDFPSEMGNVQLLDVTSGMVYSAEGKVAQAREAFAAGLVSAHDFLREVFPYLNERERMGILHQRAGVFDPFVTFVSRYRSQHRVLGGDLYDMLLWTKSMVARSLAAMRASVLHQGDPEALKLLDELTQMQFALSKLRDVPHDDVAKWSAEMDKEQADADGVERQLLARSQAFAQQSEGDSVSWRDVQHALKPGEAAVEYLRYGYEEHWEPRLPPRYAAVVITYNTRAAPVFIDLGDADVLEAAPVADYSGRISRFGENGSTKGLSFYDAFWKPLLPSLGSAHRIYISPMGVLNQASFGIVPDPKGHLLMEKYDLQIVSSTADILRTTIPSASDVAVLVGNPAFDLDSKGYLAALDNLNHSGLTQQKQLLAMNGISVQAFRSRDLSARGTCPEAGTGPLCPLPGAQAEIDGVSSLLRGHGWTVSVYEGNSALEEVVQGVTHPRILHIATHGFFLPDQSASGQAEDPMLRSGLYFAAANATLSGQELPAGADSGVLTAYEAASLDLQGTDLVVLSGCDTGLGASARGDGVFGLNRALQEAGANAVMMSMWSVPDKETEELMTLFYTKLLSGEEKHAALRDAELAERDVVKQRYGKDLPYYWGAFVIVGR